MPLCQYYSWRHKRLLPPPQIENPAGDGVMTRDDDTTESTTSAELPKKGEFCFRPGNLKAATGNGWSRTQPTIPTSIAIWAKSRPTTMCGI